VENEGVDAGSEHGGGVGAADGEGVGAGSNYHHPYSSSTVSSSHRYHTQ
jgi:hypothetical protein